ncbi:hypothetical protein KO317_01780 [Candidatus Micrarchaeota archaeon]|nr:hypothetical protein [Candidatus Micrarchaeota archaeon]
MTYYSKRTPPSTLNYPLPSFMNIPAKVSTKPKPPRRDICILRQLVNSKHGKIFEEDIKIEELFKRNSDVNETIAAFSKSKIPAEIQEEALILLFKKYIDGLTAESIKQSFNNIKSCGNFIREKTVGFLLYQFFKRKKSKDLFRLHDVINTFKKEGIKRELIKFERLYCGNKDALDKTTDNILNSAYSFKQEEFEYIFLELLDVSIKYGDTKTKGGDIQKGAVIIAHIESIISYCPDKKIFISLMNLAKKKRQNEGIQRWFKEIQETAVLGEGNKKIEELIKYYSSKQD